MTCWSFETIDSISAEDFKHDSQHMILMSFSHCNVICLIKTSDCLIDFKFFSLIDLNKD